MLKEKVAVVTGFSRGLGFDISREFAQGGATVIMCSRNTAGAEKSTTLIKGDVCPEKRDVTNPHGIAEFVRQVTERHRRMDVLAINAGHTFDRNICNKRFHEIAEEDFERVIDVGLKGTSRLSQAAIALMMKNNVYSGRAGEGGGVLIKIASISAIAGHTVAVPYGIGKSGVIAIIKHIALEFGNKNIRTYTLALCNICTDATFRSMSVTERKKGSMENSMKRWGHRRELATIAVSVASKDSGFATRNKIIVVDGGTVML